MQPGNDFVADMRAFSERARELGLPDTSRFYWYHTIDLGDGLITPGMYDYRETISAFQFPEDMRGMTVLDAGSATGFFAFEFERRGARVVSVELPSLENLDRFPGQDVEGSLRKIERMIFPGGELSAMRRGDSERELYRCLLEGPFEFCRARLGSSCLLALLFRTLYDLTAEKAGVPEGFDFVFVGDVLVHIAVSAGKARLAALAALCTGTLVLAQMLPEGPQSPPAMIYVGGDNPDEDEVSWFLPNRSCLTQMMSKLRFRHVEEVGMHRGLLRPGNHPFERVILRGRK